MNETNTRGTAGAEASRKQLDDWLHTHNARRVWERNLPNGRLEGYQVGPAICIVQLFGREAPYSAGWELYVPAAMTTNIVETLEAAEKLLDLPKPTIERTQPMRVHKNIILRFLRNEPESWRDFISGGGLESAEDAIAFLESSPLEWIDEIVEAFNAEGTEEP